MAGNPEQQAADQPTARSLSCLSRGLRLAVLTAVAANPVLALPVERCVNLGNTLDAPAEGDWGPPLARSDIDWIAAQGFDSVRLPVRFHAHWNGAIDPGFLGRVDEVIDWTRSEGLTVILVLHHFDPLMHDPDAHAPVFLAIWEELARHYAAMPGALIFELLNEPSGVLDNARLAPLYAEAIAAIRDHSPERWIIVGGDTQNGIEAMLTLDVPADARIALTFHYYDPLDFTHQLARWRDEVLPPRDWGSAADHAQIATDFDRAALVDRPVLLGEFGVAGEVSPEVRTLWTEAVRRTAEARGFGWCIWALGAEFPIRDRTTGHWVPGFEQALLNP